jgi:hypothetical protein
MCYLDLPLIETNSFHLTGDNDLFLVKKLILFCRDIFLSESFITLKYNNPYLVSKFAKENELHESIVFIHFHLVSRQIIKKLSCCF